MNSPLAQFTIKKIFPLSVGGVDFSFTNASAFMLLNVGLILFLQWVCVRKKELVPSRLQSFYELYYERIAGLLKENASQDGLVFFPFIFSLFSFVLTANMLGMIPYSFTVTSHIVVTFALALMVFLFVTILGFVKHGFHFFSFFYPKGVPLAVAPLVIPIEIIAYLIRPVTLGVRLFANMLAGHIVLKLFASFTLALGLWGGVPFLFVIALTAFEFLIAFLQAYVLTVLTCIYLNDALHLH